MKKAVCSGYYGFGNFGDDAVLKVLIDGVSKYYDVIVLSVNPVKTSQMYNIKSEYAFNLAKVFKSVKGADVLISGGGSLLQDITSFKSLLYYLLVIYLAIVLKKDVIIFAQGFSKFRLKISELLVKYALKQCKIITVRDKPSKTYLEILGIKSILICDPVFLLPAPLSSKNGKIGIQLRSFKGVDDNFLTLLADTVNKNFENNEIVIYSLQDSLDLNLCLKFKKFLKVKNVEIKSGLSVDEAASDLSSLEYLIAMRFHAVLIGLKAGVKVLPIVYDEKVRTLSKDAGIDFIELSAPELFNEKISNLKILKAENYLPKFSNKTFDFEIFNIT